MAWDDFKRLGGWNVSGLGVGTTNPWSLSTSNNLTFEGDGVGHSTKDLVKKNGEVVGYQCTYLSGDKVEVKYKGNNAWYIVTRLNGTLTCMRKQSGGLSWTAVEG